MAIAYFSDALTMDGDRSSIVNWFSDAGRTVPLGRVPLITDSENLDAATVTTGTTGSTSAVGSGCTINGSIFAGTLAISNASLFAGGTVAGMTTASGLTNINADPGGGITFTTGSATGANATFASAINSNGGSMYGGTYNGPVTAVDTAFIGPGITCTGGVNATNCTEQTAASSYGDGNAFTGCTFDQGSAFGESNNFANCVLTSVDTVGDDAVFTGTINVADGAFGTVTLDNTNGTWHPTSAGVVTTTSAAVPVDPKYVLTGHDNYVGGDPGTLTIPTVGNVLAGSGTYGVVGALSTPTLTIPTVANVISGSGTYGNPGSVLTPTYQRPNNAASDVLAKVYVDSTVTFGPAGAVTGTDIAGALAANTVKDATAYGPAGALTGTYTGSGGGGSEIMIPIAPATVSVAAGATPTKIQDVSTASNRVSSLSLQVSAPSGCAVSLLLKYRVASGGDIIAAPNVDFSQFLMAGGTYPVAAGTTSVFTGIGVINALDSVLVYATHSGSGSKSITSSGSLA